MERFPSKKLIPTEDPNSSNKERIRSWRAPEKELDKAVGRFLSLTQHEDVPREDAIKTITEGWEKDKIRKFISLLPTAEEALDLKPVSVEKRESPSMRLKEEMIDEQKVTDALRAFKARAVDVPSDMRFVFDEVAKDMELTSPEQAAFARRIMGMFTANDILETPEVSEKEELSDTLSEKFKGMRARIHINPDGTAELIQKTRGSKRRRKGNNERAQA